MCAAALFFLSRLVRARFQRLIPLETMVASVAGHPIHLTSIEFAFAVIRQRSFAFAAGVGL